MKKTLRKLTLMTLLVTLSPIIVFAKKQHTVEKHNLFADVGYIPGFSLTYNYIFHKHFGMGIGCEGYKFSPTRTNPDIFVPAIYEDMRFYIHPRKSGFFFIFIDFGIDFYKHNDDYYIRDNRAYYVASDNGVSSSVGIGYCLHLGKRGGGLYLSLKTVGNFYSPRQYNVSYQDVVSVEKEGSDAICIGYKF